MTEQGLEVVQTQVDELLPLKNKLDELRKRVKEFRRAINDVLNNDEDMDLIIALPSTVAPTNQPDESDGAFYTENSNVNRVNEGSNNNHRGGSSSSSSSSSGLEMKSVDHMDLEMLLENYLNEVSIFIMHTYLYFHVLFFSHHHHHHHHHNHICIYMYMSLRIINLCKGGMDFC